MSDFSLYTRMREHGTLAEEPRDVPDARFALPSTINWMHSLAILVGDLGLNFTGAAQFYAKVQRRRPTEREINSICEQLLFALHQLSALLAMSEVPNKADVARVGIVTWYYGIYGAASAMVAAADGAFPDTHAATAQQWARHFPGNGLAMTPFADQLPDLLADTVDRELSLVRQRGQSSLINRPSDARQAWGCCAEYLSGTAEWEQWNIRERVLETREFKALGVEDFRTRAARAVRDAAYAKRGIAFLHQASRYRGKANYRDAIYLAYGKSVPKLLDSFISDLVCVSRGFAVMAAAYVSSRIGSELWSDFLDDFETKRSISVSPKAVWS